MNEARGKLDKLGARTDELERQLVAQTTEAEVLSRRVQELEARLSEQGRLLAEREFEIDRLRGEPKARASRSRSARRACQCRQPQRFAANQFRSDIGQLEAQLAAALEERPSCSARLRR